MANHVDITLPCGNKVHCHITSFTWDAWRRAREGAELPSRCPARGCAVSGMDLLVLVIWEGLSIEMPMSAMDELGLEESVRRTVDHVRESRDRLRGLMEETGLPLRLLKG